MGDESVMWYLVVERSKQYGQLFGLGGQMQFDHDRRVIDYSLEPRAVFGEGERLSRSPAHQLSCSVFVPGFEERGRETRLVAWYRKVFICCISNERHELSEPALLLTRRHACTP